jgi:hypothetical protein
MQHIHKLTFCQYHDLYQNNLSPTHPSTSKHNMFKQNTIVSLVFSWNLNKQLEKINTNPTFLHSRLINQYP